MELTKPLFFKKRPDPVGAPLIGNVVDIVHDPDGEMYLSAENGAVEVFMRGDGGKARLWLSLEGLSNLIEAAEDVGAKAREQQREISRRLKEDDAVLIAKAIVQGKGVFIVEFENEKTSAFDCVMPTPQSVKTYLLQKTNPQAYAVTWHEPTKGLQQMFKFWCKPTNEVIIPPPFDQWGTLTDE